MAKTINLMVKVQGQTVFATPTGLKLGKGKVTEASAVFAATDKSNARKLRKALRRVGEVEKAAMPRIVG